ncbi:hypothetical protein JTE90_016951 [Oedothorax gibbosus]|uniref:Uncharacterized protein n=1 Tax=Oedothorax gibbosus TaxID=931172 RepID=A0AAV6TN16_9ARAC|nr:hypothetical protein JTE90_016951 [Oedothorax gibbosus]
MIQPYRDSSEDIPESFEQGGGSPDHPCQDSGYFDQRVDIPESFEQGSLDRGHPSFLNTCQDSGNFARVDWMCCMKNTRIKFGNDGPPSGICNMMKAAGTILKTGPRESPCADKYPVEAAIGDLMEVENAPSIFSEQEYQLWMAHPLKAQLKCCTAPDIHTMLCQDRAMDEPPSLYLQCKHCGWTVKTNC